jgi:hypothetical protein
MVKFSKDNDNQTRMSSDEQNSVINTYSVLSTFSVCNDIWTGMYDIWTGMLDKSFKKKRKNSFS